ncbi:MAG: FAD binding domain-containing protein [Actinomycetota bacterium]
MDLIGVEQTRVAATRDDLALAPGERLLGGGTWLFSEPQEGFDTLVDLTGLGWPAVTETDAGLAIAGTCTIATLAALPYGPLFSLCANSLLASYKIWNVATVGGNIAMSLPAGPMTSLAVAYDATLLLWTATDERTVKAGDFVTGVRENVLAPGEVIRAIEFTRLGDRTGFRRIALSPLGRTGTLVTARVPVYTGEEVVFCVTGGTERPVLLRFDRMPSERELTASVREIDCWYDDAHGAADWRAAMSLRLALELREELS